MNILRSITLSLLFFLLAACAESSPTTSNENVTLEVFKTPTCGCCKAWVSHIEDSSFNTLVHNQNSIENIKQKLSIPQDLKSCHTAVSKNGFFFEGHIPAKFIHAFLSNPPAGSIGLAVPGMPAGSPGMEMGDRFSPYSIILLKSDGSREVYAEVSSIEEQF